MTIKELKKEILEALTNQEKILHISESENSLLINCNDESCFFSLLYDFYETKRKRNY